jgi:hypothetical protein
VFPAGTGVPICWNFRVTFFLLPALNRSYQERWRHSQHLNTPGRLLAHTLLKRAIEC